jgi:hypothetical protein
MYTSTLAIYVSWESFTDVEEYKTSVHSYGIKEYHIGIGMYIYINIYIIEPSQDLLRSYLYICLFVCLFA